MSSVLKDKLTLVCSQHLYGNEELTLFSLVVL
jgi:hypothetical protein